MEIGVKVVVVYFKKKLKGIPPFFNLAGHPQTKNEQNQFAMMVVESCEMDVTKDRNAVLLNESTYGVACKAQFNKTPTLSYPENGKK